MSSPYATLPEFDYVRPTSLDEALKILDEHGENAKVLAGGVGLVTFMLERLVSPKIVVDIKRIPELRRIEYTEGKGLILGSAARISEITRYMDSNPEVKDKYKALYEALSRIADLQIRNRATIGGNICEALPFMDSYAPLALFDARLKIASVSREREASIIDFVKGPGFLDLAPNELLVSVELPEPPPGSKSGFSKIVPAIEYSVASVALLLANPVDPSSREVRIAVSAATPTPVRVREAEKVFSEDGDIVELLDKALDKMASAIKDSLIEDPYASAEYRLEMLKIQAYTLFKRLLDSFLEEELG
ncbi:MAG: xanthine dehydrogenase family protein subunit M [Desulfurococcales archaeon]|nr:xanthine dehydrogenase family protein subunit M [Desulfurococcales archaeon]